MVNPYYFIFYILYRITYIMTTEKDRLPFGVISLMGLGFVIHSLVLFIVIKTHLNYQVLPTTNKFVFGGSITILFYVINHFLFERNDRYIMVVEKIRIAKTYKKISAAVFLYIYMLSPLIIYLLS